MNKKHKVGWAVALALLISAFFFFGFFLSFIFIEALNDWQKLETNDRIVVISSLLMWLSIVPGIVAVTNKLK